IPKAMSRTNPSPLLLTSLLPMKPAIRPSTIHAMIDMVWPSRFWFEVESLDDLIRPQQHRLRNHQSQLLGRLAIDDQFEFGGLLHGQVGWTSTLENLHHVGRGAPELFIAIWAVGHETTRLHPRTEVVNRRYAVPGGEVGDLMSTLERKGVT